MALLEYFFTDAVVINRLSSDGLFYWIDIELMNTETRNTESKNNRKNQMITMAGLAVTALFGIGMTALYGHKPTATIQTPSEQCKSDIEQALQAFKTQRAMPFSIEPSAIESLATSGTEVFSYYRDGKQIQAEFGITKEEDACFVSHIQICEKTPGMTECHGGSFGQTPIPSCQCQ